MPRTRRFTPGGYVYHVLNRANAGRKIFTTRADYEEFVQAMREALGHVPIRVLSWCLMPDHWHLVLWPRREGELSEFMRRLSVTHTRRWHSRRHSSGTGHLYQGRTEASPSNRTSTCWRFAGTSRPTRCGRSWRKRRSNGPGRAFTSTAPATAPPPASAGKGAKGTRPVVEPPELTEWPVAAPRNWAAQVDVRMDDTSVADLRRSVQRGTPFGSPQWQATTCRKLRLESTMRPRGRPRKYPRPDDAGGPSGATGTAPAKPVARVMKAVKAIKGRKAATVAPRRR